MANYFPSSPTEGMIAGDYYYSGGKWIPAVGRSIPLLSNQTIQLPKSSGSNKNYQFYCDTTVTNVTFTPDPLDTIDGAVSKTYSAEAGTYLILTDTGATAWKTAPVSGVDMPDIAKLAREGELFYDEDHNIVLKAAAEDSLYNVARLYPLLNILNFGDGRKNAVVSTSQDVVVYRNKSNTPGVSNNGALSPPAATRTLSANTPLSGTISFSPYPDADSLLIETLVLGIAHLGSGTKDVKVAFEIKDTGTGTILGSSNATVNIAVDTLDWNQHTIVKDVSTTVNGKSISIFDTENSIYIDPVSTSITVTVVFSEDVVIGSANPTGATGLYVGLTYRYRESAGLFSSLATIVDPEEVYVIPTLAVPKVEPAIGKNTIIENNNGVYTFVELPPTTTLNTGKIIVVSYKSTALTIDRDIYVFTQGADIIENSIHGPSHIVIHPNTKYTFVSNGANTWKLVSSTSIAITQNVFSDGYGFTIDDKAIMKSASIDSLEIATLGSYIKTEDSSGIKKYVPGFTIDDNAGIEEYDVVVPLALNTDVDYIYPGDSVVNESQTVVINPGSTYSYTVNPGTANDIYIRNWKLKLGSTVPVVYPIKVIARKDGMFFFERDGIIDGSYVRFDADTIYKAGSTFAFELTCNEGFSLLASSSSDLGLALNKPRRKYTGNAVKYDALPHYNKWISGTSYVIGDIIINDGKFYRCTTAGTQSTTTFAGSASKWTKVTFSDTSSSGVASSAGQVATTTVADFNSGTVFNAGDEYVFSDDGLLTSGETITTGDRVFIKQDTTAGFNSGTITDTTIPDAITPTKCRLQDGSMYGTSPTKVLQSFAMNSSGVYFAIYKDTSTGVVKTFVGNDELMNELQLTTGDKTHAFVTNSRIGYYDVTTKTIVTWTFIGTAKITRQTFTTAPVLIKAVPDQENYCYITHDNKLYKDEGYNTNDSLGTLVGPSAFGFGYINDEFKWGLMYVLASSPNTIVHNALIGTYYDTLGAISPIGIPTHITYDSSVGDVVLSYSNNDIKVVAVTGVVTNHTYYTSLDASWRTVFKRGDIYVFVSLTSMEIFDSITFVRKTYTINGTHTNAICDPVIDGLLAKFKLPARESHDKVYMWQYSFGAVGGYEVLPSKKVIEKMLSTPVGGSGSTREIKTGHLYVTIIGETQSTPISIPIIDIISITAMVRTNLGTISYPPGVTMASLNANYAVYMENGNIVVRTVPGANAGIMNGVAEIQVTYKA